MAEYVKADQFDFGMISQLKVQKRKRGNQGRRDSSRIYMDVISAFDIETTNDDRSLQAFMYIWQFQIGDQTVIGRTWDEFITFLEKIAAKLKKDQYLVIFVHNLSFEFQFLRGIYEFQKEEVFAIEPRKVLKCEMMNHFEFRCSYLQTNMSLAEFTHKMGVEAEKLSGEDFDYSKARYPWTELTENEILYCINDVKGLVQAMQVQMNLEHDSFYTLPLTSTGYVRRDVREAMRHYNKRDLKEQLPDYEIFQILREAFRGGNTHSNRYYTDWIQNDVKSYDIASSYPNVQINCRYPMSPWLKEDCEKLTLDDVIRRMIRHGRACLMRVKIFNIRLRDPLWGAPYIPKAKCRNLKHEVNDNGRILSAEYLEISLTDIDLLIILDEYDADSIEFMDFYHSRYGMLPRQLRETVLTYFRQKTELKGVDGQELYYMKAKNKLNSIYGMSVQSPVKQSIDFLDDYIIRNDDEKELLDKSNKRAFQNYAWGVWTTAHARRELENAIKTVGNDFVYCDTDSVKYLGNHDRDFQKLNAVNRRRSKENGGYAVDPKGNEHYLGVFEFDGSYKRFVTMGAKKYAYEYPDGSIGLTVAGVGKKKGALELAAHGGLEAFKEGFVFRDAGGTESIYNDSPVTGYIEREGRKIWITSNVYIRESEYTLGVTAEYWKILNDARIWMDLFENTY